MASESFKDGVTQRFNVLAEILIKRGVAKNNSAIARLMNQPVQIISKLLNGERIITLEQASALSDSVNLNANWLLTGMGEIFVEKTPVQPLPDDLIAAVAAAIVRHEMSRELGDNIINKLSVMRDELLAHKDEINGLNQRIIKMLELSRRGY